jgi:hypothetical protein
MSKKELGAVEFGTVDWETVKVDPLIAHKDSYYVLISHQELDHLVGRLMQMCDVMGDKEQRDAVKSEIKYRTREWLDDKYAMAGYVNHEVVAKAKVIEV